MRTPFKMLWCLVIFYPFVYVAVAHCLLENFVDSQLARVLETIIHHEYQSDPKHRVYHHCGIRKPNTKTTAVREDYFRVNNKGQYIWVTQMDKRRRQSSHRATTEGLDMGKDFKKYPWKKPRFMPLALPKSLRKAPMGRR